MVVLSGLYSGVGEDAKHCCLSIYELVSNLCDTFSYVLRWMSWSPVFLGIERRAKYREDIPSILPCAVDEFALVGILVVLQFLETCGSTCPCAFCKNFVTARCPPQISINALRSACKRSFNSFILALTSSGVNFR